jgi:hypothetical protein
VAFKCGTGHSKQCASSCGCGAAAGAPATRASAAGTAAGHSSWSQQLVTAGVRISYAQLLAAANSMVAGAEVWVLAQRALAETSDIPATAVAVCCGGPWVSLHSELFMPLLQLVLNTFFYLVCYKPLEQIRRLCATDMPQPA